MNPIPFARTSLVVTLLALPAGAFAQSAFAQSAAAPASPASQTGPASPTGPATTAGPSVARAAASTAPEGRREGQVERRIRTLHARLKITPQQEAQWEQFAQVMRDNARNADQISAERAQRLNQQMSAVDDLQSYAEITQAHAQDVQRLVPAFQALYNSLSPEQRTLADQVFRNRAERFQRRAQQRMSHHG